VAIVRATATTAVKEVMIAHAATTATIKVVIVHVHTTATTKVEIVLTEEMILKVEIVRVTATTAHKAATVHVHTTATTKAEIVLTEETILKVEIVHVTATTAHKAAMIVHVATAADKVIVRLEETTQKAEIAQCIVTIRKVEEKIVQDASHQTAAVTEIVLSAKEELARATNVLVHHVQAEIAAKTTRKTKRATLLRAKRSQNQHHTGRDLKKAVNLWALLDAS
jgi:hypothetical protein